MESLFKLSDLETRISLNMNVLSRGKVPNVLDLRTVLWEWLEHRKEVLVRRTHFRLEKIARRLEVLEGYLVAYLNLDEVIRIIRFEDEPKQELMRTFDLTEVQTEAILNMRLRALRKLEELEIRREHEELSAEQAELQSLLASDEKQWARLSAEIAEIKKAYGPKTDLGARRTSFAEAPDHDLEDIQQAMIEREPITVVVSAKGWIRALKGHVQDLGTLSFKQGDKLMLWFHGETTDKVLALTTGGRVFTLAADRLPGGRGHGEPIRILADIEQDQDIVSVFVHRPDRRLLMISREGRGFVVPEKEILANTRKGKQVLNVAGGDEARICIDATGDRVAVIGENRKMLVFPLDQIPEMTRGRGVRLQRYKDGGIADAKVFAAESGLTWIDSSGRSFTRTVEELRDWTGDRAAAGRLPPNGFPRSNRFGGNKL